MGLSQMLQFALKTTTDSKNKVDFKNDVFCT